MVTEMLGQQNKEEMKKQTTIKKIKDCTKERKKK